ncbi:uncharacterized protein LOC132160283 isoform X2 [Carassius carassius]|uniref:uncharacterized protein LOC132160283 isoform X2 n=1 Tax=Carassius carassius TaxID=217509 RepID=UPI002868EDAE|nr:uncharacterized protein LOC132160283 isoform X2 [Carassius carassius]
MEKMFCFFVFCCFWHLVVFGVEDEVKSVTEGESVDLQTHVTELQTRDLITWTFGHSTTCIALINKEEGTVSTYDDVLDGKFRNRLKLDHQTGSLTITNTRNTDSGLYTVNIKGTNTTTTYRFNLTVYARLHVPVISSNSSQNPSSSSQQNCSLLCSVVNVGHVTLSWYKGNSLLSSISVSDLSISLSLPLEVECLDDFYSCVVAYSFSNQTTLLNNTQHCQPCSESVHCCGFTEAVIRLVISALVGVATVAVLVYDIRPRKEEQQRRQALTPTKHALIPDSKKLKEEDEMYEGVIFTPSTSKQSWAHELSVYKHHK